MSIWQAKSRFDARVSRRCLLLAALMTTCAPFITSARAQGIGDRLPARPAVASTAESARKLTDARPAQPDRLHAPARLCAPFSPERSGGGRGLGGRRHRRHAADRAVRGAGAACAGARGVLPPAGADRAGIPERDAAGAPVGSRAAGQARSTSRWSRGAMSGPGRWRSRLTARSTTVSGSRQRCRASSPSAQVRSPIGYSRPISAPASPRACP